MEVVQADSSEYRRRWGCYYLGSLVFPQGHSSLTKGELAQIKHQPKLLQFEGMDPQSRDDGHLEELPPLHTVTNLKDLIEAFFVHYAEPFFTKIIWLKISIRTQSCNFLVCNKHSYPPNRPPEHSPVDRYASFSSEAE